jgi:DNA-binding transcriptional MerR regulator
MDEATPSPGPRRLLRQELAAASGVHSETLRYYEKAGVLTPTREKNGYRLYCEADLKQLKLIQRALGLGFSLAEIRLWLEGNQEAIRQADAALERKLREVKKLQRNLAKRLQR